MRLHSDFIFKCINLMQIFIFTRICYYNLLRLNAVCMVYVIDELEGDMHLIKFLQSYRKRRLFIN